MLPETGSVLGNTLVFYFRIVKPSLTGLRKVCPSERAPQSLFRSTLLTKGNGASNFPHFDFEPALADSGDQDRNRESILAVTFSRCEFC